MSSYILSNGNRFYAAIESVFGQVAAISSANRFPAFGLRARQVLEPSNRIDKTGTRTYTGQSKYARRRTAFEVRTYLSAWNGGGAPSCGPLFQAAFGATPRLSGGQVVGGTSGPGQTITVDPHGFLIGDAVSYGNEIRFVTAIIDENTFGVNAPFSQSPQPNSTLLPTVTYKLSTALPSITLYDYWDPLSAVSRIVTGASVDSLQISVNGDYHDFTFDGPAADILDSASFEPGSGGLASYPSEPVLSTFNSAGVPGHLGQVWLGRNPDQFFTLTEAVVQLKNNLETRTHEFGSSYPKAIVPGAREVQSQFTVLAQDDSQTKDLYAASKQRSLVPAMLQLGQQQGQLMGIYLPQITPEIPHYNDSDTRLQWEFNNNLAQGTSDDEIYIAFA